MKKNELMVAFGQHWIYFATDKTTVEAALKELREACEAVGINTDNMKITRAALRNREAEDIDIL